MKKLDQLTFTRFIAALSVVIYHSGRTFFPFNTYPINPLFTSGSSAVGYFFVLSGFVMSLVYYRPGVKFNFKGFWLARFSRIYPIYLVSFLLTCVHYIDLIGHISTRKYLAGLLLYQAWIPDYALSFNFPAWSLSIEVFFYLIFPFIVIWASNWKHPLRWLIWLSVAFWVASQLTIFGLAAWLPNTTANANFLSYFPLIHLCSFLLGAVGGMWYVSVGQRQPAGQAASRWILALGLALVAAGLLAKGSIGISVTKGLLAPFFLVVVLALTAETTTVAHWLSHPWLVRLGDASYGVYILHMPVRWIYEDLLKMAHLQLSGVVFFYSYVAILVLLSLLLFTWLERPARDWLRINSSKLWLIFGDAALLVFALFASYLVRVGMEIRGYTDSLNFALRMGIPTYLFLLIVFRAYAQFSARFFFTWIKRSLLPVVVLGAAILVGLMFFALRFNWIGTFPRSMLVVNVILTTALLLASRFLIARWKPALSE